MKIRSRLASYHATAIISLVFALVGFSYNTWRLEVSERNNTVRTASFEILIQLSEFERVAYAAHYDNDPIEGNPRLGWVKVGVINDLCPLVSEAVSRECLGLKSAWQAHWDRLGQQPAAIEAINQSADALRERIRTTLLALD
ncbi:hypothetical protein [Paraferrimonas sedimenticola]|uniref:Uncharacterized protein n=1 Tax=Paraferrimonas sedimenticola TaxID=375674 RepID=A0AA37W0C3_9GAMM|nr:hypothetical protein [Paraferrimonas sedimenticola]GLP97794.1 hypothetical protein GCM10007895_31010 [Paraferrimonas sedimenticola]